MQSADWRARFDALEARKTSEAAAATIEPFTTELDQPDAPLITIGNAWSRAVYDGLFYVSRAPSHDLPSASLVLVRSREGNIVAWRAI